MNSDHGKSVQFFNDAGSKQAGLPPGAATALKHPSQEANVYLVGIAHVSARASRDAYRCITAAQPSVVVLELDKERYKQLVEDLEHGDPFGLRRTVKHGIVQPLKLLFSGQLVEYGLHVAYAVTGALLGTPPGHEFHSAVLAAQEVGAELVLADRDQDVTLRRLARAAMMAGSRPDPPLPEAGKPHPEYETPPPADDRRLAVDAAPVSRNELVRNLDIRWREVLRNAGCYDPDAVVEAFQRILDRGTDKRLEVLPEDVATVRECGQKIVEKFRWKAIKEGDPMLDQMEVAAIQSVASSGRGGMPDIGAALAEVLVRERDLVLARRLWEAGQRASGRPVVGIVGAGHVQGIAKNWAWAGTPQAERTLQELSTPPPGPTTPGSLLTAGIAGGAFAYLAYRRPKVAAVVFGAAAFVTTPYVGAIVYNVNRCSRLLEKVVDASTKVPPPDPDVLQVPDAI